MAKREEREQRSEDGSTVDAQRAFLLAFGRPVGGASCRRAALPAARRGFGPDRSAACAGGYGHLGWPSQQGSQEAAQQAMRSRRAILSRRWR